MTFAEIDDIVCVYCTGDPLDAHALAAQLAEEGIDARVVGNFLSGGLGLTVGTSSRTEVWVPTPDRHAAAALIAQWRTAPQPTPSMGFRFSLKAAMLAMTLACFGMLLMTWGFNLLAIFEILLGWCAMVVVVRRWIRDSRSPSGGAGETQVSDAI